jgi:hypothetical protein
MTKRKQPNLSVAHALAPTALLGDIRRLIVDARTQVAAAINAGLTLLYWEIGERIRKDILQEKRAEYGEEIVTALAQDANGGADLTLDLAAQTLRMPSGRTIRVDVPAFRREQLLSGADEITLTLRRNRDILAYQERERAARPWLFLAAAPKLLT